ncbi:MAG: AAA family ATPase [Alicyclobacillus sp.]|nr:AAA family ATPase [Alicyclobacillus sp.]
MTEADRDWPAEQARVDALLALLRQRAAVLRQQAGDVRADVVELRRNFWDEVTLDVGSADDWLEAQLSIRQQAEVLAEQERRYQHAAAVLRTLERQMDSPYFARVDFIEDGGREIEKIYIGLASFQDETGEFWVYDWRAPIASLYYDATPGPVAYAAPAGTVRGEMRRKRQFLIRGGRIRLLFDTQVTIGDELLMALLSRRADAQMRNIVATIQAEQNRAIRDDQHRLLVVLGPAGSGKTAVALQRIAYLMYKHRQTLRPEQVVLLTPNPLFSRYIANVLPELGEQNVPAVTWYGYAQKRLGETFAVESPFAQWEALWATPAAAAGAGDVPAGKATTGEAPVGGAGAAGEQGLDAAARDIRWAGVQYKGSLAFMRALAAYADQLMVAGLVLRPLQVKGETLVSAAELAAYVYHPDRPQPLPERLDQARRWLLQRLSAWAADQTEADWVEDAIQHLSDADYRRAERVVARQAKLGSAEALAAERKQLAEWVVERRLQPLRTWVHRLAFVDVPAVYRQLFTDPARLAVLPGGEERPEVWPQVCAQTVARLDAGELAYEDVAPYLYLLDRILGQAVQTDVRYVLVDEAQDYSPLQVQLMHRLFPRAKLTLLGDPLQALAPHGSALAADPALPWLDETPAAVLHLQRSYRTTREIAEFAQALWPVAAGEPFARPGERPRVAVLSNRRQLDAYVARSIAEFRSENWKTIAVLCKTAAKAAAVAGALRDGGSEVRLASVDHPDIGPGVWVIPVYLAKGLEFDAVVVYDASPAEYGEERDKALLYTACTRPLHRLRVTAVGALSPWLAAVPANLYMEDVSTASWEGS